GIQIAELTEDLSRQVLIFGTGADRIRLPAHERDVGHFRSGLQRVDDDNVVRDVGAMVGGVDRVREGIAERNDRLIGFLRHEKIFDTLSRRYRRDETVDAAERLLLLKRAGSDW